jgi:hypothetical protein
MVGGTQARSDGNYVKHLQQRTLDLRAQLKRCLASAEANRNNGHAMDNYLVQAARLRKQIATAERRLETFKTRDAEKSSESAPQ